MDANKQKIRLIEFFQDHDYLERAIQISASHGYDNYLDYYICQKLSPVKYLKTKIRSKLRKEDSSTKETETLLNAIDPKGCVCIISPLHKDKKLDGFYKRVQQVDEDVLNGYTKIYLDHTQLGNRRFSIERYDDEHITVTFNSFNDIHIQCVKKIIEAIRRVYIHSVHMLMPDIMNYHLLEVLFDENNKTILDLHGAVPEELKEFDTKSRSETAEFIEEIALDLADRIICMSDAMGTYYSSKYGIDTNKMITMTILPFKGISGSSEPKTPHDPLTVVYAGGIQKWQNIDLIKESVKKNQKKYRFKIFTHDSEKLKNDWSDIQNEDLLIGSRNNDEIYAEYEDCDFGYLLRDDTVVNRVALPTKMMEYLRYGIIPILKTDRIGNLKEYGLNYVSLQDFNEGKIPDPEERKKMAENNYQILLKIIRTSENGLETIREYIK